MLIRSQNKKSIIVLENIKRIYVRKGNGTDEIEYLIEANEEDSMGSYSSEEKAIKVLDMIQNKYSHFRMIRGDSGALSEMVSEHRTFIMPQDSQVEV